jgi:hypothetical protein
MSDLSYPIGPFVYPEQTTAAERRAWIRDIAEAPAQMRAAVAGLAPNQLATPYRPGGWTAAQVVHHVPESHMHSFIRFKWALTEDHPTIKPYNETRWAEVGDYDGTPVEVSLQFLEALHRRWLPLLESLKEQDYSRTFHHPESGRDVRLDQNLALYSWHGRHHIAHIVALRSRMGW